MNAIRVSVSSFEPGATADDPTLAQPSPDGHRGRRRSTHTRALRAGLDLLGSYS